ncbi:PKD domain-containing protein [Flammeovirga yaeyamensis]|uniref:PKD domain-containing protein n=1 Tax=Flammeovirga yaeyamensis TaxID=367791 RepID=A0AAX1NBE1_9BACT|nr:PKD domain-containing protein [Flammeovirga yaeyamensis]MBB3697236.1 PKD repeat protein [Flammeovirga yaeyamensis]NMF33894.1 PKD domain-containing protein [Flammeovirga yaeyamensis]QWG04846.1 PKD domain-containing protein [Flammeovirga yaeyamensis]
MNLISFFRSTFILICLLAFQQKVAAQWYNTNPGHGGQLQHVICDPNIDGKMYLCSDMEGYYVSHDYGQKWIYVPSAPFNNVFNIAVAPSNSNTLLMGSTYGVALSKDDGENWEVLDEAIGYPVQAMAIDPSNENNMYFAPSWLEDEVRDFSATGVREVFSTVDGGATWHKTNFEVGSGKRNVLTISVHPSNGEVLLAAQTGLYLSNDNGNSWTKQTAPNNTGDCMGATITEDGQWVYSLFIRNDGNSGLYVKKYNESDWTELDANGLMQQKDQTHWRPMISGKSTATQHYVMMGTFYRGGNNEENALLEGTFSISGDVVAGTISEVFKYPGMDIKEIGWNAYQGVSRTYSYYPASWTNHSYTRGAFIMSQQSAYVGDVTDEGTWDCVTSTYVKTLNGRRFFRTNGTASTYNWDMTGYKNYVVQGMADNGLVESYDGGETWNQPSIVFQGNWNSDALETIIKDGEDPLILAATANGFGGATDKWDGRLLMKRLTNLDGPSSNFSVLIDGNTQARRGLEDQNRISSIHSDPLMPERVYVSTIGGAYVTDDIFELIKGNSAYYFRKISNGAAQSQGRRIISDPNDSDVVYLRCGNGTFRGDRQPSGDYVWTKLLINNSDAGLEGQWGSNGDLTTWADGETSYLLVTKGNSSNEDYELWLSADKGANFTKVVDRATALQFRNPEWLDTFNKKTGFGGLVGQNDEFYFTFHSREHGEGITRGISFLKAKIGNTLDDITLEDLTGDYNGNYIEFPVARRGKIWKDDNEKQHLYIATMGTGMWKLALQKPEAPVGVIKVDQDKAQIPATIQFDASESMPFEGRSIEKYEWDFGNGATAEGTTVNYTYEEEGVYSVTLVVTDNLGDQGRTTKRIEAIDLQVRSVIKSTHTTGFSPLYIGLDGTDSKSTESEIVAYRWMLNGQVVAETEKYNPYHPDAGTYKYILEVENANGEMAKDTLDLEVLQFTGESSGYKRLMREDMEGFSIIDPNDNGQMWGGLPRHAEFADDNTARIHFGPNWGVHASAGYEQASGLYSAFIQNDEVFSLQGFDISGHDHVKISLGMMKFSVVDGNAVANEDNGESLKAEWSTNGNEWNEINLANKFTYNNEENGIWYWVELDEQFPSVENLRLRFTRIEDANSLNTLWRIDDIYFGVPTGVTMDAPTVNITTSKTSVDRNEMVTLSAEVFGTASKIEWDFGNDMDIAFGLGPHEISYEELGKYDVKIRAINHMGDRQETVTIRVSDQFHDITGEVHPSKEEVFMNENVVLVLDHNGEVFKYEWDFGEGAVAETTEGEGPHVVKYSTSGMKSISVKVTTRSGQVFTIANDDVLMVKESDITSSDDLLKPQVVIYPNPASETIQLKGVIDGSLEIINLQGQLMQESSFKQNETINLELPKGIYFVRVYQNASLIHRQKLIIK